MPRQRHSKTPEPQTVFGSEKKDESALIKLVDPVSFAEFYLNHKTWTGQREMLRAIARYHRVAVKACHASSKTFSAAEATLWWLTRRKKSIVLTTSPTGRQVEAQLWGEIRKTLAARPRINYPQINLASFKLDEDRWAMGFSTSPENLGTNLHGFHGAHLLVIIDEATGVEGPIWDAIEGARAGGDVHQLVLCNPVVPSGPVYEIFTRQRAQWHTITINAFDTPNLKCACQRKHGDFTLDMLRSLPPGLSENGHPAFAHKPWPELVSRYWVYEMYWKYGEESAFFESRVLGQFPTQAEDALYSLAKLEAARAKPGEQLDDGISPIIVGIDVAGPGKDETVVSIRCGSSVVASKAWNERDAAKAQGAVVAFIAPFKPRVQCINCDSTGIGHYFPVALAAEGYRIRPVNFGAEPEGKGKPWQVRCANRKAEVYWRTKEVLDSGGIHGLDANMISQAAQVKYFYDLKGRVAIESKANAAKRGLSSPDRWESVVLAFGVDPYESLAQSLAFARRTPVPANGQVPPTDPRYEELERERREDTGQRYTNPSRFSHIGRFTCW